MDANAAPIRRTQAERRAETRQRLLEAAVECVIERGYSATTTVEVQRRAGGISRGALQYYWPSKAALLVDAVNYLFESTEASLISVAVDRTGPRPSEKHRIKVAIETLWQSFDTPLFRASREMWHTAQFEPELRLLLIPHEHRLGEHVRNLCITLFGEKLASHRRFESYLPMLINSMRGAALTAGLQPRRHQQEQMLAEWIEVTQQVLGSAR